MKLSPIDLNADLTEPLNKLIETIKEGIGAIYEPTKIRRKAKAISDAMITLTNAEISSKELVDRAAQRLGYQEIKRQINIESIISKTITNLPEKVDDTQVNPDWISNFFEQCKDISNEELQELWSRLLAREVASPSQISQRTLSILKTLTSAEARIFQIVSNLCWEFQTSLFLPQPSFLSKITSKAGIGWDEIFELQTIGLFASASLAVITIDNETILDYQSTSFKVVHNRPGKIQLPAIIMTKTGKELYKSINKKRYEDCFNLFITHFESEGLFKAEFL